MEHNWYDSQQYGQQKSHGGARKVGIGTLVVCMLITSLLGGAAGGFLARRTVSPAEQAPVADESPAVTEQAEAPAAPREQSMVEPLIRRAGYTTAEIVEKCAPSIVGIDVKTTTNSFWYGSDTVTTGSGSGIIIREDGYIITNHHVIEGAEAVTVYLHDDTEYEATLVGTDKATDLAVIKIDAANLTAAEMGSSASLMVGEDVVAIGNPLGELRGTATNGIVSALSRDIKFSDGTEMNLLQTNAAINPGNSGGGLFDSEGKLIGIVNAKVASSSTEGLGFAIPVDNAKQVIADLMDLGYVTGRAYLGVYLQNVAIQSGGVDGYYGGGIQDFFGFGGPSQSYETRVQVVQIVLGSAAEQAGIQAGDLILKVGDREVTTSSELSNAIAAYKAGDTATILIERNGVQSELTVTFGEQVPE